VTGGFTREHFLQWTEHNVLGQSFDEARSFVLPHFMSHARHAGVPLMSNTRTRPGWAEPESTSADVAKGTVDNAHHVTRGH